ISRVAPFCGARFDLVVARALAKDPASRLPTMRALADELAAAAQGTELVAGHTEVARLVRRVAEERLASRRDRIRAILARDAEARRGDDDESSTTAPLV